MDGKHICCICGKEFEGWGNNPDPVLSYDGKLFSEDDVCCDECNGNIVIPARIIQFYETSGKE